VRVNEVSLIFAPGRPAVPAAQVLCVKGESDPALEQMQSDAAEILEMITGRDHSVSPECQAAIEARARELFEEKLAETSSPLSKAERLEAALLKIDPARFWDRIAEGCRAVRTKDVLDRSLDQARFEREQRGLGKARLKTLG